MAQTLVEQKLKSIVLVCDPAHCIIDTALPKGVHCSCITVLQKFLEQHSMVAKHPKLCKSAHTKAECMV
jgi:hypothetical protein